MRSVRIRWRSRRSIGGAGERSRIKSETIRAERAEAESGAVGARACGIMSGRGKGMQ
jgi:hypothetical protein